MKVLLDTNIILDYLLNRAPATYNPATIWEANQQGRFEGYVAAITPINMAYIIRRKPYQRDEPTVRRMIQQVLTAFEICPVDITILQTAWALLFTDYEDAVQHASANALGLDAIVTENLSDYNAATIPIYSGAAFIALLP